MKTELTYDDYLRDQEMIASLSSAFDYCIEDDETKERCPMCGEYHPVEDFDGYKGQRMCSECIELERINDNTLPEPNFANLFTNLYTY